MSFSHTPVLLNETIQGLNINPNGIYVDCTLGGGGHSLEICKRLTTGCLIGLDQDEEALQAAEKRLSAYPVKLIKSNFSNIKNILLELGDIHPDGILMDLGVSSHQLDSAKRGFSYHEEAFLDMRMSGEGLSAYDVVNQYPKEHLEEILFKYGEEKFAKRIVSGIIKSRETAPVETTLQLAEIIKTNVPLSVRREKNPCKKTFQAIRIEVNRELEVLEIGMKAAFDSLCKGGRLAIITFHSLEDRMVKLAFRELAKACVCPPDFPICVCGGRAKGKLINRKPIMAAEEEIKENIRSRTAKLRIIEKL